MTKPLIDVLVADTGAFLRACPLHEMAARVVTVPEVVAEIRDKATRERLRVLPYELELLSPSEHHMHCVSQFARQTGDWRHLSAADVKLLALTRQLTVEHNNGSESGINLTPPLLADAAASGSGAPRVIVYHPAQRRRQDSDAWESQLPVGFVTAAADDDDDDTTVQLDSGGASESDQDEEEEGSNGHEQQGGGVLSHSDTGDDDDGVGEVSNTFSSIDLSNGSRADSPQQQQQQQREEFASGEKEQQSVVEQQQELSPLPDDGPQQHNNNNSDSVHANGSNPADETAQQQQQQEEEESDGGAVLDDDGWITPRNLTASKLKMLEQSGQETVPLKVACLSTDFSVQNVLKQMALQAVSLQGRRIREARRFLLRCHGCFHITPQPDAIFCPHCGYKTLKRVAVTVQDDGTQLIHISARKPISLRGTIFPIPRFRNGKHARNPVLMAHQRQPEQRLSKRAQTRNAILSDDFMCGDSPFAIRDVTSRSAQLGLANRSATHRWQRRNPNAVAPSTGNRRKRRH